MLHDCLELTKADYEKNQQSFTWSYDDAGNRLSSTEDTVQKTYAPNNLNQYTTVNSTPYTYDADGNLLSDGTRAFTWDVKNRLTQVVTGGKTITYKYDHNDWRVEKTVDNVTTKYLYDGNLLLAETDNTGKIQKVYINDGQGIVGMVRYIYKEDGTFSHYQPLYYMFDSLGSVSLVTGEDGKPLQTYKYTPYGKVMNAETDTVNGLRFIGKYGGYQDDDTNLTYFWHRWYESGTGRWINRDPIGLEGGINLMNYVNNSPLNTFDSSGLDKNLNLYDLCRVAYRTCQKICKYDYNECKQEALKTCDKNGRSRKIIICIDKGLQDLEDCKTKLLRCTQHFDAINAEVE